MLYIITPCSRPENLPTIYSTIPKESIWIIAHDDKTTPLDLPRTLFMKCDDLGLVGTKGRNYILDNFNFNDDDLILFHDDDNIIHPRLYSTVSKYFSEDFSMICWGQLKKDNNIRLFPPEQIKIGSIDTACFLIKWKYNKNIRHVTYIYEHDGIYAQQCANTGPVIKINDYLAYYNYLR